MEIFEKIKKCSGCSAFPAASPSLSQTQNKNKKFNLIISRLLYIISGVTISFGLSPSHPKVFVSNEKIKSNFSERRKNRRRNIMADSSGAEWTKFFFISPAESSKFGIPKFYWIRKVLVYTGIGWACSIAIRFDDERIQFKNPFRVKCRVHESFSFPLRRIHGCIRGKTFPRKLNKQRRLKEAQSMCNIIPKGIISLERNLFLIVLG